MNDRREVPRTEAVSPDREGTVSTPLPPFFQALLDQAADLPRPTHQVRFEPTTCACDKCDGTGSRGYSWCPTCQRTGRLKTYRVVPLGED